jgi:hypothetical protein
MRVYGYASLVGPALFSGAVEQGAAMLDMALAACRDPEPGMVGEALEVIENALSAAGRLLADEDGRPAAIDLIYRSISRAATELPERGELQGPGELHELTGEAKLSGATG